MLGNELTEEAGGGLQQKTAISGRVARRRAHRARGEGGGGVPGGLAHLGAVGGELWLPEDDGDGRKKKKTTERLVLGEDELGGDDLGDSRSDSSAQTTR